MTQLQASGIGHRFGSQVLFRDLSLRIRGGESLAVTGSNGAGKTTLLHILAGLRTPAAGLVEIRVDGRSLAREDIPLSCALVAPYLNVYDGFSVRENLQFIARVRGLGEREARIASAIERVGLEARRDDLVATFSSGMKQRVKFAAAVVTMPAVLLLDEPSTNLDALGRTMVEEVEREHLERGGILVVATNDDQEASRCASVLSVETYRSVSSEPDRRLRP